MGTNRRRAILATALGAVLALTGIVVPAQAARATAAIQGTVLSWMEPLANARVTVFDARTGRALRSAVADGEGAYRIDGLPPVGVKVRATKAGYLDAWAGGDDKARATVYLLAPGQVLAQSWDPMVLYLDLPPEAVLAGVVHGLRAATGTPCERPVRRVRVVVRDAVTGGRLGAALTRADGSFRVGGLRTGAVVVRLAGRGWVAAWSPSAPGGASYEVAAGTTTDAGTLTLIHRGRWRACSR